MIDLTKEIAGFSDTLFTLMRKSFVVEGNFTRPVTCSVSKTGILTVSIDSEWYKTTSHELKEFYICREALRLISRHTVRRPDKKEEHELWQMASDVVLNSLLFDYYFFDVPENEPMPEDIEYTGELIVENVFEYLKKLMEDQDEQDGEGEGNEDGDSTPNRKGKPKKGKGKPNKSGGKEQADDSDESEEENEKDKSDNSDNEDEDDESEGDDEESDGKGKGKDDSDGDNSDGESDSDEPDDSVDEDGLDQLVNVTLKSVAHIDEKEAQEIDKASAGNDPSKILLEYKDRQIVPKRRWETIVHEWAAQALEMTNESSMAVMPKHLSYILNQINGRLEGELHQPKKLFNRIAVTFFSDTSGSCVEYFPRFCNAALSLPEDKFDSRLYCFDTSVYPVDRSNMQMYGGGGTSFQPIINEVHRIEDELGYKPVNFIITDAYFFDRFEIPVEERRRWYFFLVEGSNRSGIPEGCHVFDLSQFE